MDRRKALREQYKRMKPEMGLFVIRARGSGRCYLEATADLKSTMNGSLFKLKFGNHPVAELQNDRSQFGEDGFEVKVLDTLAYAEDESKTDYADDLEQLRVIWQEELANDNVVFY